MLLLGGVGVYIYPTHEFFANVWRGVFSLLTVLINALMVAVLLYSVKVNRYFSLLPAAIYILGVAAITQFFSFRNGEIAHLSPTSPYTLIGYAIVTTLLVFLWLLSNDTSTETTTHNTQDNAVLSRYVFVTTIVLTILALVNKHAVWLIPLLWVAIIFTGGFSIRYILASVIGIAGVMFVCFAIKTCLPDNSQIFTSVVTDALSAPYVMFRPLTWSGFIIATFNLILIVAALWRSSHNFVSTRIILYITAITFLAYIPLGLFLPSECFIQLLPFTLAVAGGIFFSQRQTEVRGGIAVVLLLALIACLFVSCSERKSETNSKQVLVEDHLVNYPGRTFSYKQKFNDLQSRQLSAARAIGLPHPPADRKEAAAMKKQLTLVKTGKNYIVDSLTHSVPYLVPKAKRELDSIGEEWAEILRRNGLPHYRFYVTSVLRTEEDVRYLQRSGNINSTTQSCHCYGTTFDLAYARFDKVTRTNDYMLEDNLKLVLGQALLNEQRKGHIFVKYEWQQACFHITCR